MRLGHNDLPEITELIGGRPGWFDSKDNRNSGSPETEVFPMPLIPELK